MTLSTDRLDLKPFKKNDFDAFKFLNTNPFIRKYIWDDVVIDDELINKLLRANDSYFKEKSFGLWKIYLKSELIGYVGLWYFFDEDQPQLIYALLEKYTGKGYATEAGKCMIKYAFEKLNFTYLVAAMDKPHEESQSLAKRLGMHFVEYRKENGKETAFYRIETSG